MNFIAERLHAKGSILMMQGFMGQAAQIKRDRGAREVLAAIPASRSSPSRRRNGRAKAMT